jgi:DNA-binding NarL/FixJ family response regulator
MNEIILADRDAVFCASAAEVLTTNEDVRIVAQCEDLDAMYHAVAACPGSTLLFAASLRPDLSRLRVLLETTGSRAIVVVENCDSPWPYLEQGFAAVVFRCVSSASLLKSVREVANGSTCVPVPIIQIDTATADPMGMSIHARIRFNHITFPAFNTKRNAC